MEMHPFLAISRFGAVAQVLRPVTVVIVYATVLAAFISTFLPKAKRPRLSVWIALGVVVGFAADYVGEGPMLSCIATPMSCAIAFGLGMGIKRLAKLTATRK
jgi:hypothetical protein